MTDISRDEYGCLINPYSCPEDLGLKIIGDIELTEPDYSFDTVLVVQDIESGKLYAAHDSGCSCPSPFEDTVFPTDFVEIIKVRDFESLVEENSSKVRGLYDFSGFLDLKRKISEVLK